MAHFNKPYNNIKQANNFITPVIGDAKSYYPLRGDANNKIDGTNNGTVNGASIVKDATRGLCYSFDGTNDYISGINGMAGYTDFSVSLWKWQPSLRSKFEAYFSVPAVSMQNSGTNYRRFSIYDNRAGTGTYDVDQSTISADTGSWVHIMVTASGSTYKRYINGVEEVLAAPSSFSGVSVLLSILGARDVGGVVQDYFLGKLSDLMIWDRTLSAAEISTIYTSQVL